MAPLRPPQTSTGLYAFGMGLRSMCLDTLALIYTLASRATSTAAMAMSMASQRWVNMSTVMTMPMIIKISVLKK